MATVFWDTEGVLLIEYHSKGNNVNQQTYQATLKKLCAAIRRLHPGLRDDTIFLIQENAALHTAASVQELLHTFHYLTPGNFLLFPQLKRELGGKCFRNNEGVKRAINSFLRKQSTEL